MDSSKLARIRALLAKAESTTFPEEAETYTNKAMTLMVQYGIDDAMLAASGEKKEEIITRVVEIRNPYSKNKIQLLYSVAQSQSCMSIAHPDRSGKSYSRSTVVGYESDVDRVELLFTSLLLQASGQLTRVRPDWRDDTSTTVYRKAWFFGFVDEISKRLDAIREHATQQSESARPGTALVLADRDSIVKARFNEMFPRTRDIGSTRLVNAAAYRQGKNAAQNADLNQTRFNGSKTALPH